MPPAPPHPQPPGRPAACSATLCETAMSVKQMYALGALYCVLLCFSYVGLQTVKWSDFKKEFDIMSFLESDYFTVCSATQGKPTEVQ